MFTRLIPKLKYIFFFLFVFSLPLQKRHIFSDTLLAGEFNEWTAISLYLSDIFLILTFLFWLAEFLAKHKPRPLPITRYPLLVTSYWLLVTILVWSTFSLIQATNLGLAVFRLAKLLELFLLFIFVTQNLKIKKYRHYTYAVFLGTMLIQSLIALGQYWQQKSLGFKIFGENDLSAQIIDVAKIVAAGEKIMRPYGTFPHPNVLAGFLITAIMFCFYFWVLKKTREHDYLKTILLFSISFFTITLALTLSRSAWLGLVIALIIFIIIGKGEKSFAPTNTGNKNFCSLPNNQKNYRQKIKILLPALSVFTLTAIIVSIIFWPQIASRGAVTDSPSGDFALSNRVFLNQIAFNFISEHPWFGIGIGNFTTRLRAFAPTLATWQLQPVHYIYFSWAAEIGIPGLLLFLFFIWRAISFGLKQICKNTEIAFLLSTLFAYFTIGFLDHYFYDLEQGMLIFWLILGLIWTILLASPKSRLTE
ncbi:MAG: O-antigen ligase family protein [bacterium]|nr:O-antigen ligase family protein [bacterium]